MTGQFRLFSAAFSECLAFRLSDSLCFFHRPEFAWTPRACTPPLVFFVAPCYE
jgi:hypothetical protein